MRRKRTNFQTHKRRLFAILAIGLVVAMLLPAGALAAGNLILNPEFDSGTANWSLGNWGGAASSWSVVTGAGLSGANAARVVISNPGTASYHVQLRQPLPIIAGKIYTITFRAKANASRTMNVVIQQLNDPWTTYWTSPTVNLTTMAQTFGPYTFTAGATDAGTMFAFYLGGNARTVYLDQVVVSDGSVGPTATHTRTATPIGPTATRTRTPTATPSNALERWDDFNYSSPGDSNIGAHGWVIRTGTGGPGEGGPSWSSGNFAFVDDGTGNRLMRMSASNSGTASISSQAEIHTTSKKFLYGTYAARIFWRNAPSSGSPDGDQVIQTFFSITLDTPLCDDFNYGELDFEYLPNGGFAFPDGLSRLWNTSWDRCTPEEYQQNTYLADWSGWHKIIFQVTAASVKYYIDGTLLATHGAAYAPEVSQNIDFNLWFFRRLANATSRTYQQDVDWTYFIKDASLSPAEVDAKVNNFRGTATTFKDTVP